MSNSNLDRRSYQLHRDGGPVLVESFGGDFLPRDAKPAIEQRWIAALDTESFRRGDEPLVTSVVTLAFDDEIAAIDLRDGAIVWRDPESMAVVREEALPFSTASKALRPIEIVLTLLFAKEGWAQDEPAPSKTKQRPKLTKEDRAGRERSRTGRDGRRVNVPVRILAFHNLPYDVTRLFPDTHSLRRMHAGVDSWRLKVSERFEIEWVRYADKGAHQFAWYVRDSRAKRVLRLKGFDTFNYLKASLKEAAKAMQVSDKLDMGPEEFERDLDSFTREEWTDMLRYASQDANIPRRIYSKLSDLLRAIDLRVLSADGTIPPSAPAAAAIIAFAKAFDHHPELRSWARVPEPLDRMGALAYHGARVLCPRPGIWRDLVSLDLKSAYPWVMAMLPDPVSMRALQVSPMQGFDLRRWRGKWGVLFISGEALDPVYPAFPQRETDGRLRWHYGPFENVPVTIPEIVIGVASGALRVDEIHDGVLMEGSSAESFLRSFVLEMYAVKESEKETNKPLSQMGKLLMNALYGKLIQVDGLDLAWAENLPIPEVDLTKDQRVRFARSMIDLLSNDAEIEPEELWFGDEDDPREPETCTTFQRARDREREQGYASPEHRAVHELGIYASVVRQRFGGTGRIVGLPNFLREATSYRAGAYFMPLFASQITGFVTATQGLMARRTKAYAGDTDSVFVHCPSGKLEDVEGFDDYFRIMKKAGYTAPREGGETIGGTTLGFWELEMPPSLESILARTKRYSHVYEKPLPPGVYGPRCLAYKEAHQGIPNLPKEMMGKPLHKFMAKLYLEDRATYETRRKPRKGRDAARSGLMVGEFVSRPIQAINDEMPFTEKDREGITCWKRAFLSFTRDERGLYHPRFET